jgi:hypothetical protein
MIVEAAATHHQPIAPGTPLRGAVIVNLANRLVHWTDLDGGAIAPDAEQQLEAVAASGLTLAAWVEIAAMLQGQKSDLREFFGGAA